MTDYEEPTLQGSDYVRAVVAELITLGVPVDMDGADLDEEQCNLPIVQDDGSIEWLRWLEEPEHGWHTTDDQGRRTAPICAPYTEPAEAAKILRDYV